MTGPLERRAARVLLVDDAGRILLQHCHDPSAAAGGSWWNTTGGGVDDGETPAQAAVRELREETGLEVEPDRFLGVWMDVYADGERETASSTLNLYWTARVLSGEPEAADDVAELRWFAPAELPAPDALAFTNVALVLHAWRDEDA